jgi:hypothetical protein
MRYLPSSFRANTRRVSFASERRGMSKRTSPRKGREEKERKKEEPLRERDAARNATKPQRAEEGGGDSSC